MYRIEAFSSGKKVLSEEISLLWKAEKIFHDLKSVAFFETINLIEISDNDYGGTKEVLIMIHNPEGTVDRRDHFMRDFARQALREERDLLDLAGHFFNMCDCLTSHYDKLKGTGTWKGANFIEQHTVIQFMLYKFNTYINKEHSMQNRQRGVELTAELDKEYNP